MTLPSSPLAPPSTARSSRPAGPRLAALLLLTLTVWLAGCSTPIGADRTSSSRAYRELNASALVDEVSGETRKMLHLLELQEAYDRDPAAALLTLHERACHDDRRDLLFALAELNYLHAQRLVGRTEPTDPYRARDYHLAAAIYAWFYLLGDDQASLPDPFDRRFRLAIDIYNRSVSRAFAYGTDRETAVVPGGGERPLGPGTVHIRFTQPVFRWRLDEIDRFLPADEFRVRGLTVRDQQSGLGSPLIVVGKNLDQKRYPRRMPATLLLRAPGDVRQWRAGQLDLSLELYSSYESESVDIQGRPVPLENDTTAPLAYGLNESWVWKLGGVQFFSSEQRIKTGIYFPQPYEPGRIPVIFVHGTFSSPVWWAEMWNTLRSDPVLRTRCQFWNFIYNSGNPVTYSAANLRDAIRRKVEQLDPEAKDPALRQMVVIGHSQGGLLTKLTAVDTGDRLWRTATDQPFAALKVTPEEREALARNFFFTPLPSVSRVVFISTPHRGSYLATSFVRTVARWFMHLPGDLARTSASLARLQHPESMPSEVKHNVPTSLDSMSPKNRLLQELAATPLAPGVTGHSIIAVKGDGPPEEGGDGVVKYRSAHLDGMRSERVVRSGHSCQDKPAAIEEVRRILLEHLAALTGGTAPRSSP